MNASACNKRTTAYVVFRKSYPQTIIIIIIKCGLMLDEMYFLCSTDNALPPPPMDWRQTTAQFIANGNEQWQRWRYRCSTSGYVKNRKRMEQRQTKQKKKKYGKERTRERGYNLVLEMLHESHTHTHADVLSHFFCLPVASLPCAMFVSTIFIIIVITIRNGWKTNRIDQDMVWRAVAFVAKAHAADVHLIAFWPASVACAAHNSARFANLN